MAIYDQTSKEWELIKAKKSAIQPSAR